MNARLYDPRIGRFFSPDNFITDPESPQSYNRYSYAMNNPMSYVDPSGNAHIQPNTEEFSGLTIISTPIQDRELNTGGIFGASWDMGFEGSPADLYDCLFGPVKTYFGGGGGGGGEKEEKKKEEGEKDPDKKVEEKADKEVIVEGFNGGVQKLPSTCGIEQSKAILEWQGVKTSREEIENIYSKIVGGSNWKGTEYSPGEGVGIFPLTKTMKFISGDRNTEGYLSLSTNDFQNTINKGALILAQIKSSTGAEHFVTIDGYRINSTGLSFRYWDCEMVNPGYRWGNTSIFQSLGPLRNSYGQPIPFYGLECVKFK